MLIIQPELFRKLPKNKNQNTYILLKMHQTL